MVNGIVCPHVDLQSLARSNRFQDGARRRPGSFPKKLVGAPGLEPEPGTLKGCCAAVTPHSQSIDYSADDVAAVSRVTPVARHSPGSPPGIASRQNWAACYGWPSLAALSARCPDGGMCDTHRMWCRRQELNLRRPRLQRSALPTELQRQYGGRPCGIRTRPECPEPRKSS